MRLLAEDPDLSVLAVNTAVTTVVGLLVGLIAFPGRWFLQWRSRRRQDDVAAYRQAHRLLRDVQVERLYPAPVKAGEDHDDRAIEAGMLSWNSAKRAWDETLHVVSFTRDKKAYERLAELAELYVRSPVVEYIYQDADADPGPSLLASAIELLAWRERHAIRTLPAAASLEEHRRLISSAEAEAEDRERVQVEEYRKWRAERAAAMRQAQRAAEPQPSEPDSQVDQ
ncbi:hypothetical protein [Cellulomonas sp. KRMCY2]|uniref:hypothetical protein n=1 Tax=Cellulomonas sp. KRMCY2 TaxID=1304865 RepID=UPI00045EA3D6|nr:hypothetical protein [Cellulomonas sp. KRMCY2]